jgi:hypothetical protein
MNPNLVLIFGIAVLVLLVVIAGIGREIFRVLESIESELVGLSSKDK